jgi:hypothetical protein
MVVGNERLIGPKCQNKRHFLMLSVLSFLLMVDFIQEKTVTGLVLLCSKLLIAKVVAVSHF